VSLRVFRALGSGDAGDGFGLTVSPPRSEPDIWTLRMDMLV